MISRFLFIAEIKSDESYSLILSTIKNIENAIWIFQTALFRQSISLWYFGLRSGTNGFLKTIKINH